ncbi:hypothetical protein BB561_003882 [Smittium simulii]|uniref:Integrase zinc-binding domain-containing protein n=1 Tax=Smittium simulii TaxID=133385 RepID=A0A2T9YJ37_9FUNG|nr:hypothetical protein BB561_003882 [Smittium simulii]
MSNLKLKSREKQKKEFTETESNKIPRYENIVSIRSDATTCFIAKKPVQELNIETKRVARIITTVVDRKYLNINTKAITSLEIDNKVIKIELLVFPLKGIGIILGYGWWKKVNLISNYESNPWEAIYGKRKLTIYGLPENKNETYASGFAIGAFFSQEEDGQLYPVSIMWEQYCECGMIVHMDHKTLTGVFKKQNEANIPTDALSRRENLNNMEVQEWPLLIKALLQNKPIPFNLPTEIQTKINRNKNKFIVKNNLLHRIINEKKTVPYVGINSKKELIKAYHCSMAHMELASVYSIMRMRHWWPKMKDDILKIIMSCSRRQIQEKTKGSVAPLHPLSFSRKRIL